MISDQGYGVVVKELDSLVGGLTKDAPDLGGSSASDSESKPAPKRKM